MTHESNGGGGKSAASLRILKSAKRETKTVHSEAWDGIDIELRGMTMGARSDLLTDAYTQDTNRRPLYRIFYPMLLRACCYEPTEGTPIFEGWTDDEINSLPAGEVERIAGLCLTLSGLDAGAEKTLGEDSGGTMTSTSGTSSRASSGGPSKSSRNR